MLPPEIAVDKNTILTVDGTSGLLFVPEPKKSW
jgi:hypothetical protein